MGTKRMATFSTAATAALLLHIVGRGHGGGLWGAMAAADNASCGFEDTTGDARYSAATVKARTDGIRFENLPGYTRSVVEWDHALVTPESRVVAPLAGWEKTVGALLISPSTTHGAHFTMYLAELNAGGRSTGLAAGVERAVFVLTGEAIADDGERKVTTLGPDGYAYFPAGSKGNFSSSKGANVVIFERMYVTPPSHITERPVFQAGHVDDKPNLDTPGEVFALRKLMPLTPEYDFNLHVMDFQPGEYLNVKEVHYNQHGLLLLQGQGIYRLADKWYPVQAGDAIWMAPYVVQWYAALGTKTSRYLLYKDTHREPLLH